MTENLVTLRDVILNLGVGNRADFQDTQSF